MKMIISLLFLVSCIACAPVAEDEKGPSNRDPKQTHPASLAIRNKDKDIQMCYRKVWEKNKLVGGEMLVRIDFGIDGALRDAILLRSSVGSVPVEKCILDLIKKVPALAKDGEDSIQYSFDLENGVVKY